MTNATCLFKKNKTKKKYAATYKYKFFDGEICQVYKFFLICLTILCIHCISTYF